MLTTGRAASVPLVGGRPCLDLVNTVSWRGDADRGEDHLASPEDAVVWLSRAGVLDEQETHADLDGEVLLRALLTLRGVVAAVVDPASATPSHEALAAAGAAVAAAFAQAEFRPDGRAYRVVVPLRTAEAPAHRIALDLHALMTGPHGRVGRCEDDRCRWVFEDTSRGSGRRWCSSADCGNRHRVARLRARRAGRD